MAGQLALTNAGMPIAAEDMGDRSFTKVAGVINIKTDPASPLSVGANGLTIAVTPTTHTSSWDAVGKIFTTTVNGVTATANFGSLDDEGVALAINAGQLELKNAAGTVLSSTPITQIDAQQLSASPFNAATNTLTLNLTNGGTANIVGSVFKINTSQLQPGAIPTGVTLPAAQLTAGVVPAGVAIPAGQVTGQTNTLAIAKATGVTSTVNGVAGVQAIPAGTAVEVLGYNAAGSATYQTVASLPIAPTQLTAGALPAAVTVSAASLPATTNTLVITKAAGAVNTTNGVTGTQTIPVGTVADVIGFNAAGTPVNQTVASLPISPTQLTAGTLPNNVLVNAASLPATTVSNAITGTGATRTLSTTVNGVTGTPVPFPTVQVTSAGGTVMNFFVNSTI